MFLTPSAHAGSSSSISTRIPLLENCGWTVKTPSHLPPVPFPLISNFAQLVSTGSLMANSSSLHTWTPFKLKDLIVWNWNWFDDFTKISILNSCPRFNSMFWSFITNTRLSLDDAWPKLFCQKINCFSKIIKLNWLKFTTKAVTKSSKVTSTSAPFVSLDWVKTRHPCQPSAVLLKISTDGHRDGIVSGGVGRNGAWGGRNWLNGDWNDGLNCGCWCAGLNCGCWWAGLNCGCWGAGLNGGGRGLKKDGPGLKWGWPRLKLDCRRWNRRCDDTWSIASEIAMTWKIRESIIC